MSMAMVAADDASVDGETENFKKHYENYLKTFNYLVFYSSF